MLVATVVGPVWATKRVDPFPPVALLEVQCAGSGKRLVAVDTLGSGPGDRVLVTQGSAVAQHFSGKAPLDAMIVGVIDEPPAGSGTSAEAIPPQ
ncbi:ethanolamine utilization protein EutN [Mycobacterium sp. MS1601]|uniref:EutN/CcmL family microcompartment protein n=1 Tax=Mycobacterium sp. MS1601 TaxID=1936029 RepID=UPI0009796A45|nr:EutN/CcmL family microcompartment protein [Mycobacterium sp. MS1601]AQA05087.1 ethanolamine utilization protein EutN [Mycobacterium sp. MS1601]